MGNPNWEIERRVTVEYNGDIITVPTIGIEADKANNTIKLTLEPENGNSVTITLGAEAVRVLVSIAEIHRIKPSPYVDEQGKTQTAALPSAADPDHTESTPSK